MGGSRGMESHSSYCRARSHLHIDLLGDRRGEGWLGYLEEADSAARGDVRW